MSERTPLEPPPETRPFVGRVFEHAGVAHHQLYFRCFGEFELIKGATLRVESSRRSGREFLEYLVLHPRSTISREALIDALWPDAEPETGSHRLHVAVSGARSLLRRLLPGVDPFRCTTTGYGWDTALSVQSDVERFERCYATGSFNGFRDGVDLCAGEFLAGETADWVVRLRLNLSSKLVTMLQTLALDAYKRNEIAEATQHALRLIAIDRGHEDATRLLMRLFAKRGQRTFALAEYTLLRSHLKRYLGVKPTPETDALRQRIAEGQVE